MICACCLYAETGLYGGRKGNGGIGGRLYEIVGLVVTGIVGASPASTSLAGFGLAGADRAGASSTRTFFCSVDAVS